MKFKTPLELLKQIAKPGLAPKPAGPQIAGWEYVGEFPSWQAGSNVDKTKYNIKTVSSGRTMGSGKSQGAGTYVYRQLKSGVLRPETTIKPKPVPTTGLTPQQMNANAEASFVNLTKELKTQGYTAVDKGYEFQLQPKMKEYRDKGYTVKFLKLPGGTQTKSGAMGQVFIKAMGVAPQQLSPEQQIVQEAVIVSQEVAPVPMDVPVDVQRAAVEQMTIVQRADGVTQFLLPGAQIPAGATVLKTPTKDTVVVASRAAQNTFEFPLTRNLTKDEKIGLAAAAGIGIVIAAVMYFEKKKGANK